MRPVAPALEPWLARWRLQPDGEAFVTEWGSRLAPVLFRGKPAMLKLAAHPEEQRSARVMEWWEGDGAAAVYARQGPALLLERATGRRSLAQMSARGGDDEAIRILCGAVRRLHRPRPTPAPRTVVRLERWFRALRQEAPRRGGVLLRSLEAWRALAASPAETVVLHGDIHHDNVLDFGARGWLAIDPKGIVGDRGYDYANMLCNPSLGEAGKWLAEVGTAARLSSRLHVVTAKSGLERRRVLLWLLAYTGLSASWTLQEGDDAGRALRMAALAEEALDA
ncbi:MAG TPA: aminoglycoside phosphotransferase family protein [Caulobacteraceae bacterium]|nr:aminoglycoside phosphotransferase family protein [Caulobacteraceae bacterium]